MLARTGSLPDRFSTLPIGIYKSLNEARRLSARPVCVFPEATTGNGRAVLRFPDGIFENDVNEQGVVHVLFLK